MDAQQNGTPAATLTRLTIENGLAVVTMDSAPGNALAQPLRAALMVQLGALLDDPAVQGIVLTGGPRAFSTGLDIRELEKGEETAPRLGDLCDRIAASPKPVVAAIHVAALGMGLELALACHARVADPEARLGFPELLFGLIPGAGGTQRLPRLLGADAALTLLLSPRQHAVTQPMLVGLCDAIVADPVQGALDMLRDPANLAAARAGRDGFADPSAYMAAVRAARSAPDMATIGAPGARIVDCVEVALLLPPAQGLEFERAAHEDCRLSEMTRGLLHAHFAVRRAVNMPELQGHRLTPPARLGVVGSGPAATGIVASGLAAGLAVIQFERSTDALTAAAARLDALPDTPGALARRRWQGTTDLAALADCDLVIEAVAETPQTKAQVFAALGQATRPGTVLATNSLIQSLAPMAEAAGRPEDVLALHFHGPARTHPLAEIVITRATSPAALARAVALAETLGKHVVRGAGGAVGIGERMQAALRDALAWLVQVGVAPASIDTALLDYGFAHAPLAAMDRIGLDLVLTRGALMARDGGRVAHAHLTLLRRLNEVGRKGRASGLGFYRWQDDTAHADPALTALLPATAQSDPGLSPAEIVARCLAAMANEGARLLREDIALRPSDIDTVMVLGYGFPRAQGGPMKAADMVGVFDISLLLRRLAELDPVLYAPDPGFAALARNGENFDVLNRVGRNRRRIPD